MPPDISTSYNILHIVYYYYMLRFLEKFKNALKILSDNEKTHFFLISFFGVFNGFIQILAAFLVLPFMTFILSSNVEDYQILNITIQSSAFYTFGLGVILFQVLASFSNLYLVYINTNFTQSLSSRLSIDVLKEHLFASYKEISTRLSGDYIKKIITDSKQLSENYYQSMIELINGLSLLIFFSLVLIVMNIWTSLSFIVLMSIFVFMVYYDIQLKLKAHGRELYAVQKLRNQQLSEILSNIKLIKIFNAENFFLDLFTTLTKTTQNHSKSIAFLKEIPKNVIESMAIIALLLFSLIAKNYNSNFENLLPIISFYTLALYRLLPSVYKIVGSLHSFSVYQPVFDYTSVNLQKQTSVEEKVPLLFMDKIIFRNVSFKYEDRDKDVLTNVNFEIRKHQFLGIYGTSGKGKTTFFDLLLGLYTPDHGEITMDGQNIHQYDLKSYYALFGYVSQDIYIFNMTVLENIAFAVRKDQIDKERVFEVLKKVDMYDFVKKELKDQENTLLGEKGISLSGGQRQRIGIARVLYFNPQILIFDEATNALDAANEQKILDLIKSISKTKTVLMVSHRLDSLKPCDQVFELKQSKLIKNENF